jgi:hypothetical protein
MITHKSKRRIEKQMNALIKRSLWEPSGDPDEEELEAAAAAYIILSELNLKCEDLADVLSTISGDNSYKKDFLL